AVAGREHHWLMPRIPWILEIGGVALNAGHAMALAAKVVELTGGEPFRVARMGLRRITGMRGHRSVARLAANAQLVWRDDLICRHRQGTRGMAAEQRRIPASGSKTRWRMPPGFRCPGVRPI